MTPMALVPLCALALSSLGLAQIPVPGPLPGCGGVKKVLALPDVPLVPRYQDRVAAPSSKDLCSVYTHAGWKDTVRFRLGENASEYKPLVELAIKQWNEALVGFNQKPLIELSPLRPRNYSLHDDFWYRYNTDSELDESHDLIDDGQSVIYFKGNDPDNRYSGFAYSRWDSFRHMKEADVYINLTSSEKYAPFRVKVRALLTHEGETTYVPVLSIYLTILHEIGHAIGLQHVPVSGNIMSYNYMPHMVEKWKNLSIFEYLSKGDSILRYGLFSYFTNDDPDYRGNWYYEDPSEEMISAALLFTATAGLGEQDRMSLLCAYDFSDWNH